MARKEEKKSKYGSLRDTASKGADQLKSFSSKTLNIGDMEFWRPEKAGKYEIDIIPYEVSTQNHPAGIRKGNLYQQVVFEEHRNVGPEEKKVICPRSVGRGKCPICEEIVRIGKDSDADQEEASKMKAKKRVAFNVIDLADKDGKVKVYENSPFNFANELYKEMQDDMEQYATLFDLQDGFTIKVRFDEESMGKNKFLQAGRIDFLERDISYPDSIVEECCDLDKALIVYSYDELYAILHGVEGENQGKEEQEGNPSTSQRNGSDLEKEEEKQPVRSRRRPGSDPEPEIVSSETGGKCPNKLTFGEDCETEDCCDSCEAWSDCRDEKEKLDAAKNTSRRRR